MPRTGKVKKGILHPDPIYKNRLVSRLINGIMRSGKKTIAQKHVYQAFEQLRKGGGDPILVFNKALKNVGPQMEVRPRRVGGASYQVPMPVRGERRIALAIRWLVQAASKRPNSQYHTFSEKLAAEIFDASQGQGEALRRKELVHKMAEGNKAFAHFRW